jgi:hypothetical protein
VRAPGTHRPTSYSVEAIGLNSEWIVRMPSYGLSGAGFTIFASTCASTLAIFDWYTNRQKAWKKSCPHLVLPSATSTMPSSAPKANVGARSSNALRPSRRRPCSSARAKKSFSGMEGDGGRIVGESKCQRRTGARSSLFSSCDREKVVSTEAVLLLVKPNQ